MPKTTSNQQSRLGKLALAAGFFLCFFVFAEVVLGLMGIGWSGRFFLDRPDGFTVTNPRFGRLFYPEELLRAAYPAKFATEKPKGVSRIFVLGESAVAGTPEPSFSVTRVLKVLLEEACPEKEFEVINAGVTAMNSHAVRLISRELSDYGPDAVIVYMGNNEFVGPFGPGSILGRNATPNVIARALIWLRSTRCGQLLQSVADRFQRARFPEHWTGMDMFSDATVAQGTQSEEVVYRNFASNLRDIALHLRQKRVPILLCSVASNLTDCPPLGPDDPASKESAQNLFDEGRRKLASGDRRAALELLREARDKDTLRFRADSRITSITRRVAAETGSDFVDLENTFAEMQVGSPPPENPIFFEHVHFTFEGNTAFAAVLAKWLGRVCPKELPCLADKDFFAQGNNSKISERLGYSEFARGNSIAANLAMLRKAPFDRQPGNSDRILFWENKLRAIEGKLTPDFYSEWIAKLKRLTLENPGDGPLAYWLGLHLEDIGKNTEAAAAYERSLAALPGNPAVWSRLGDARVKIGDRKGAAEAYREGLGIFPASRGLQERLSALEKRPHEAEKR
jgi:tetratricopeptide (TPR) repeat protein